MRPAAMMASRRAVGGVVFVMGLLVLLGLGVYATFRTNAAPPASTAIAVENQQPGSQAWRLPQAGFRLADDVGKQVKGYASAPSVNKGEPLTLYITASPAQNATIDVFRMGWYGGNGGRLLHHAGPITAAEQPPCATDDTTGLMACNWTPTYTLDVPENWTTGAYVVVLTNDDGFQNYIPFVVRDDSHPGGVFYKQPVNTYQAYNNYPDDRQTGKSLYDYNSYGGVTVGGSRAAVKVSFDRPYAHDGAGDFFKWEYNLIRWLERSGYELTYMTDVDMDVAPQALMRPRAILSGGHDEYWTRRVYLATARARDNGVNLAFFAANAAYWQVRYEPSASNVPDRVMVCYRDADIDPVIDPRFETVLWGNVQLEPDQVLLGISIAALLANNMDYVVINSNNWVYGGTGLRDGDIIQGIVGYEADSALQYPIPRSRQGTSALLSYSPALDTSGKLEHASASIYQAPSGAWVFASGTTSWNWALDADGYYDPRIGQATANLLQTFLGSPPRILTAQPRSQAGLYRTAVLFDAPLAYWRPAEPVDGQLPDATGNHFDGLLSGGLQVEGNGAIVSEGDAALHSDGTGKIVLRSLPPVVNFTIEAWSNLADATWNSDVFFNNAVYGSPNRVRVLLRPGGAATSTHGYFGLYVDGTEYALQPPSLGASNVGQWVHWAFTRQAGTLSLYRNGVQVAQRVDLPPTTKADVSGTLYSVGDRFQLKGGVDDVAVYSVALTPEQIRDHVDLARRQPTSPVITPRTTGREGDNGWFVSDVSVSWTIDSGGFDLRSTSGCEPVTVTVDTPGLPVTCTVTSLAGETSQTLVIRRDTLPPTIQATRSPAAAASGWNNTDVTVRFTCQDQTSGVAACPDPAVVSADGADQSVAGVSHDLAGHEATVNVGQISVDKTPPKVQGVPGVAAGEGGWYAGDVVIHWSAEDALSGVAALPGDSVITGEGTGLTARAQVADRAGNVNDALSVAVNIDRSPPSVLFTGNQRTYTVDQTLAIGCAVLDSLSGPSTPTCQGASGPAYSFGVGQTTVVGTAADRAGNTRSSSTSFTVEVTSDSLCALSRRFAVTDAVGRSVCGKLAEAAASTAGARDDAMQAYIKEVQDQTGQAFVPDNAAILTALAGQLYGQ